MAEPKVALRNIRSIGTIDDPVEVIHVKIIQQLENLSHELSTMGVGTETFAGQTFDTGTNAITMIENTIMSGTFQTTGIFTPVGHINLANQTYFISGDGLVNKGMTVTTAGKVVCKQGIQIIGAGTVSTTFNVTGFLTANGGIKLNGSNISDDGGLLDGISISGAGHVTCHKDLYVNSLITSSQISTTGDIQSSTFIDASTGFKKSGTAGLTGTFDKAVDNTLTYIGGIITGKT